MLTISGAATEALAHCSRARRVSPPSRARPCDNAAYAAASLYELGKCHMQTHRFAEADELFAQCETILHSFTASPAAFRSLRAYRAQCASQRALAEAGLVRDVDGTTRALRHQLAGVLPHVGRATLKRYAWALARRGVDRLEALCVVDRGAALAQLTGAGLATVHAHLVVVTVVGEVPWYEKCLTALEWFARFKAVLKAVVPAEDNAHKGSE